MTSPPRSPIMWPSMARTAAMRACCSSRMALNSSGRAQQQASRHHTRLLRSRCVANVASNVWPFSGSVVPEPPHPAATNSCSAARPAVGRAAPPAVSPPPTCNSPRAALDRNAVLGTRKALGAAEHAIAVGVSWKALRLHLRVQISQNASTISNTASCCRTVAMASPPGSTRF